MRKALKLFFITLAALLGFIIIAVCITVWFVFTPAKLTPMAKKQADKFLTCKSEIGSVELTFFSTFPQFGMKIDHFALINPIKGTPNDTLIVVRQMTGIVDLAAWWKDDKININKLFLNDGSITIFTDSLGNTNYDIFKTDTITTEKPDQEEKPFVVELKNIQTENIDVAYIDHAMKLDTRVKGLVAELNGNYESGVLSSTINLKQGIISLRYGNEKYLTDVVTQLEMNSIIGISPIKMEIKDASGTLNTFPVTASGFFAEDTTSQNLLFGLDYSVASSPVEQLLTMVPPSFQSYFEGIETTGMLAADGKITGIYNDSTMPIFDVHLMMENGMVKYEGLPIVLNEVKGDVTIRTDSETDSLTFVRLNHVEGETVKSSFVTTGLITQLFSAMNFDLTTDANLELDEFNAMIPTDMKMKVKGNAKGQVKTVLSMEQLDKMQLEKMKFSGTIALTNFEAEYDSMRVKADKSTVKFDLPNSKASGKNTKFAFADISANEFRAGILNGAQAYMSKTHLLVETSDVRDTTRIPNIICSFSMDSLQATMDTIRVAVRKPAGRVIISPRTDKPDQPQIRLTANTKNLSSVVGTNSLTVEKLNINTDIENHKEQKDIFLQWLVKGAFDMEKGIITMKDFNYPIEIPSIRMNLTPETLNIKDSRLKVDQSDFQLTGTINNMLDYYRGDSILRGKLNFTSNTTDVLGLMTMTSGIGYKEETPDTVKTPDSSGPYMVPKGIDITLATNVKYATFGNDSATNITGDVRIYDGILLLEEVKLTTPAARMQLTAMYRTPRKNHLFLGLDYHMFEVEIEELLQMIPDIDTLMPMLRSFKGKGEFHFAVETYLDSLYNLKKSTLRGAASITGQDLVLMDGETFTEIAKKLMFNKKTENRVDSLSAEFTIFKDEIDVYPFLIVMDKYKAVVAGRHNFDMSFDYHISVVDCPLPVKLGIDVKGTMDNLSYNLAKCKYAELYRPSSRKVVANKQLELRKMIRDALMKKVVTE
jgi:hypothetical protein